MIFERSFSTLLIEAGIDLNRPSKNPTISTFARFGDEKIVRMMIEAGADPNSDGLLHQAANNCSCELVKYLIDKGADVNARDRNFKMPLHLLTHKNIQNAIVLLKHGADLNAVSNSGTTPLMVAASNGDVERVKLFLGELQPEGFTLDQKCDINAKDNDGQNAMRKAIKTQHPEVVGELIVKGITIDDKEREEILEYVHQHHIVAVEMMMIKEMKGDQMMIAGMQGCADYVEELIRNEMKEEEMTGETVREVYGRWKLSLIHI
eukprot:TRINITY_DN2652_c0_g1_i4.p1 TRINITY_DN2652_c0_g1~~TRINITY_DN2652_c0_g1_i4.p1  ORF type:complete len:263 (+),score=68.77 TRINITY_DN2652_c0_g1_i4:558-1346(+)